MAGSIAKATAIPQNEALHWLCVPAIFFSIMGLLINLNAALAVVLTLAVVLFYRRVIGRFGCGDGAFYGGLLGVGVAFAAGLCALLGDFCVGVDRAICRPQAGGQKPSFFQDVQFLLIGPA